MILKLTLTLFFICNVKRYLYFLAPGLGPDPRLRRWSPTPICIWQRRPTICIYRPQPSVFACLFFVFTVKVCFSQPRFQCVFLLFSSRLLWGRGCVIVTVSTYTNSESNYMYLPFKVGLSPSKKYFFIRFNDSPSKMMKNALYFILKALFFLKIFTLHYIYIFTFIFLDFLVM